KGFTPLHVASKYGSLDVAKLLLQRRAPPDASGKNGLTPLHVAAHYDNQKVALLLLDKGASPHATAKNGYTPLHIAAKKNQMEIASTLLQYGAETNTLTKQGVTPLHVASQDGHSNMVALLLEKGAHVNVANKSGLTALHLAAQEDKVSVAEILVKHGANLDQQTKLGYTPLIVACHYGNAKMVNFLLKNNASLSATTKNGYTPLHQAAQQGNTHIINVLLQHGAKPNATTANGNTALAIARRLGYISVVDTLKVVTEEVVTTTTTVTEKHKLNVPETMTEVLDVSDEEGEDTMTGDGGEYLRAEDLRELGDDSLPGQYLDGMNYLRFSLEGNSMDRSYMSNRYGYYSPKHDGMLDDTIHSYQVSSLANEKDPFRLNWETENLDNIALSSSAAHSGFLVSFMVDARGGAMRGCRHNGLRIIIPPRKCSAPTRVTCRLVKRHRLATMPPTVDGDGLASRIIEVGPSGAQFLGPVIVEIPHFAALRGKERELVILRSETGESWKEHQCEYTEEELNQVLNGMDEDLDPPEELERKRICRIITRDFPQYFAVVSRIKQDSNLIGPEGGILSSTVVPQVQAVFPEGALTKRIRVGLQTQPVNVDMVRKILGNKATFSPIVTLEPRRRKFHKPITMTIPVPKTSTDPLHNGFGGDTPTLRLLCSITGGTTPAQWEDITGTTPLTFINDCVSFTTNVSARFWLIDCRQGHESVNFATQVYREIICVPYMAKFVIFAKTHDPIEARLRCFCMTDDKIDKTLEQQENFTEVARSRDVEVLEGKPIYADCFGNLVPLTKSGQHHIFSFFAFKENRLALFIKIRDNTQEPCGRLSFMKEPRSYRSLAHSAICNLNISLPIYAKFFSMCFGDGILCVLTMAFSVDPQDELDRKEGRLAVMADHLGFSWTELARELEIDEEQVNQIRVENPNSLQDQSHALIRLWTKREGTNATESILISKLTKINRMDIVHLIKAKIVQSTQDHSSHTYAEMEQSISLDHSDGFSALQEDIDSPRPVRHTELPTRMPKSGSQPPLVSAEDLSSSVSSLDTQKEKLQLDIDQAEEVAEGSILSGFEMIGLRQQFPGTIKKVSPFFTLYKTAPWKLQSQHYSQVYKKQGLSNLPSKISPQQLNPNYDEALQELGAAGSQPEHVPIHTKGISSTESPQVCRPKQKEKIITDFAETLMESEHSEADFSELCLELKQEPEDYVSHRASPTSLPFFQPSNETTHDKVTLASSIPENTHYEMEIPILKAEETHAFELQSDQKSSDEYIKKHVEEISDKFYRSLFGEEYVLAKALGKDIKIITENSESSEHKGFILNKLDAAEALNADQVVFVSSETTDKNFSTKEQLQNIKAFCSSPPKHLLSWHEGEIAANNIDSALSQMSLDSATGQTNSLANHIMDESEALKFNTVHRPESMLKATNSLDETKYSSVSDYKDLLSSTEFRSSSPVSVSEYDLEMTLHEYRSLSPESTILLPPDSPIPVKYRSGSLDSCTLIDELRVCTPESEASGTEQKLLSPDSPIPDFRPQSPLPPVWEYTRPEFSMYVHVDSDQLYSFDFIESNTRSFLMVNDEIDRPISPGSWNECRSFTPESNGSFGAESFTIDRLDSEVSPETALDSEHDLLTFDIFVDRSSSPRST
ncbi:ankyrin-2-like isoform X17, partial [Clarias magur]